RTQILKWTLRRLELRPPLRAWQRPQSRSQKADLPKAIESARPQATFPCPLRKSSGQGEGPLADLVNGSWLRRSARSPLAPKTTLSSVYACDSPSFRLRSDNCKGDFVGNITPMSPRRA